MKQIELLVVDKETGEVKHRVNKTMSVHPDAHPEVFINTIAGGILRLMKRDNRSIVQISWNEYSPARQLNIYSGCF